MAGAATTISRDQFKRLCGELLAEAPRILESRDKADPKMDKKSALLRALFSAVREKLGMTKFRRKVETDFPTYEFAYRSALYELLFEHAKEPFQYQPVVNDFLRRALKK